MKISRYKYYFAITDFLLITVSFFLSGYILQNNHTGFWEFVESSLTVAGVFILIPLLYVLIFAMNHLYQVSIIKARSKHLAGVLKSLIYGAFSILIISLLLEPSEIVNSKLNIIAFTLSALPLFYLIRVEGLRGLYSKVLPGEQKNLVIVGDGIAGKSIAAKAEKDASLGINVLGFVGFFENRELHSDNYLGNINSIRSITEENKVDELLISVDDISYEELLELLDLCNELNVNVKVSSELFNIVPQKVKTKKYADVHVVNASPLKTKNFQLKIKRALDITGAAIGLILLAPAFIILAAIIKLTSKGPVFYKQVRVGRGGREFNFYKFRSMKAAEGEDEERKKQMLQFMKSKDRSSGQKIINNNRVTWIGKYIRKTSLDELPQLFNVLKGEMSLVGPRPCLPYEYENYEEWQKRRCEFIPGCTGLWQVSGRSAVSFNDSIILDLYYIKNYSFWFDVQLMLKTIPVMFFARGGK